MDFFHFFYFFIFQTSSSSFAKNKKQRKKTQYDTEQTKNEKTRPSFLKQIPLSKSKPSYTGLTNKHFFNVKKIKKQIKKRKSIYNRKDILVTYHKKKCMRKNFDVRVQHIVANNNYDKVESSIFSRKNASIDSCLVQIYSNSFPTTNIFSNLCVKHNLFGTTKITFENICDIDPEYLSQDIVISQKTSCKESTHSVTIESLQLKSGNRPIHTVPSWLSILLCYDDDEISEFLDECFDFKRIFYRLAAAKYLSQNVSNIKALTNKKQRFWTCSR
jgi:hypothetical protein